MSSKKDFGLEIFRVTQQIELCPKDSELLSARGLLHKKLGNYEKALKDFTSAINLNPTDDLTYINRGNTYLSTRNFSSAILDLETALKIKPRSTTYFNLANAYQQREQEGDLEHSILMYTKAISIDPKQFIAFVNRALVYRVLEDFEKALEDLTHVVETEPNESSGYENRGMTYLMLKKFELARKDFTKMIETKPHDFLPYFRRATALYYLGLYEDCVADLKECIHRQPRFERAFNLRFKAYERLNKIPESVRDIIVCIRLDPRSRDMLWEQKNQKFARVIHREGCDLEPVFVNFRNERKKWKIRSDVLNKFVNKVKAVGIERNEKMRVERVKRLFTRMFNFARRLRAKRKKREKTGKRKVKYYEMLAKERHRRIREVIEREKQLVNSCSEFLQYMQTRRSYSDAPILLRLAEFEKRRVEELNLFIQGFYFLLEMKYITEFMNEALESNLKYREKVRQQRVQDYNADQMDGIPKDRILEMLRSNRFEMIAKWITHSQIKDMNQRIDEHNNTMLHHVSACAYESLLILILKSGVNLRIKNKEKKTALDVVGTRGGTKQRCVEILNFWKKYEGYEYEGDISHGKFSGEGKLYKMKKTGIFTKTEKKILVYSGNFENGKKNGMGKLFFEKEGEKMKHFGTFKNDLRNGHGIQYYENGQVRYRGVWCEGKRVVSTELDIDVINFSKFVNTNIKPKRDLVRKGKFFEVFRAKFKDQLRCLKLIHPNKDVPIDFRLENELRVISTISYPGHKNIMRFYAISPSRNEHVGVVTSRFYENESMAEYVGKKKEMIWELKLKIISDVVLAMEYLNVVHNVKHCALNWDICLIDLCGKKSVVQVCGFSHAEFDYERTVVKGIEKSFYSCPKIVKGESVDKKCDVWSFGIMMFALLLNTPDPFQIQKLGITSEEAQLRYSADENFRPRIGDFPDFQIEEKHVFYISLMKLAWDSREKIRPSFEEIKRSMNTYYGSSECTIQ